MSLSGAELQNIYIPANLFDDQNKIKLPSETHLASIFSLLYTLLNMPS